MLNLVHLIQTNNEDVQPESQQADFKRLARFLPYCLRFIHPLHYQLPIYIFVNTSESFLFQMIFNFHRKHYCSGNHRGGSTFQVHPWFTWSIMFSFLDLDFYWPEMTFVPLQNQYWYCTHLVVWYPMYKIPPSFIVGVIEFEIFSSAKLYYWG